MEDKLFFEHILEIPNLKIDRVIYTARRIDLYCHSEQDLGSCPQCGSKEDKVVRSYDRRQVRDLDISGKEVWLHLEVRQVECECGRYYREPFEWVSPGKSYTHRQAKFIFEMCAHQPFSAAAALLNMCPKTVERVYYACAEQVIDLPAALCASTEVGHRRGVSAQRQGRLLLRPDRLGAWHPA